MQADSQVGKKRQFAVHCWHVNCHTRLPLEANRRYNQPCIYPTHVGPPTCPFKKGTSLPNCISTVIFVTLQNMLNSIIDKSKQRQWLIVSVEDHAVNSRVSHSALQVTRS